MKEKMKDENCMEKHPRPKWKMSLYVALILTSLMWTTTKDSKCIHYFWI